MIIYVASYPRSGNSLIRQITNTYFKRPTTTLNPKSKKAENLANGKTDFIKNWRCDYNTLPTSGQKTVWRVLWNQLNNRIFKIHNLDRWIAFYDLNVPPYTKNCRYLLPGCKHVLTPKNRKFLAKDANSHIFIKTHELPFKNYFKGEYVIQPIRHPGAVLWSYFKLRKDFYGDTIASLEKTIEGKVPFGSWSDYHQSWSQIIPFLDSRFIRIRFEDMLVDPLRVCEQISTTIDLKYNPSDVMPSFEALHQKNPNHIRAGKAIGWEKHYDPKQLELLEQLHGSTMEQLGYKMPELIKTA